MNNGFVNLYNVILYNSSVSLAILCAIALKYGTVFASPTPLVALININANMHLFKDPFGKSFNAKSHCCRKASLQNLVENSIKFLIDSIVGPS